MIYRQLFHKDFFRLCLILQGINDCITNSHQISSFNVFALSPYASHLCSSKIWTKAAIYLSCQILTSSREGLTIFGQGSGFPATMYNPLALRLGINGKKDAPQIRIAGIPMLLRLKRMFHDP